MLFLRPLIVTMLIASCYAYCQTEEENLVGELAKISWFSSGISGFAGKQSEGERLYQALAAKKGGKGKFILLAADRDATPEARLYAACGLYQLGYDNIDNLFLQYKDEKVTLLQGDILRRVAFFEIYQKIKTSGYQ